MIYLLVIAVSAFVAGFCAAMLIARSWWYRRSPPAPAAPPVPRCPQCSVPSDPRCAANNCTYHCRTYFGCQGACIDLWKKSGDAFELAARLSAKARA